VAAQRLDARAVRALRGPRAAVDPARPLAVLGEWERAPEGGLASWLTVFLAGAECRFTCVFCDLWRHTLEGPTPPGAIPRQIVAAREDAGPGPPPAGGWRGIKLYNASNFFDERAVPAADDEAVLAAVEPFSRVLVECHPALVGPRCLSFAAALARRGARLEVAMGLETVHPAAQRRLGKGLTTEAFAAAAGRLREAGCAVRAFVLVGAPWVPAGEAAVWAVASVRAALAAGASFVSVIPVRGGNGALEELGRRGAWRPPTLGDLEAALEGGLEAAAGSGAVVAADLWDAHHCAPCPACAAARLERLERLNLRGLSEPPVACPACGSGGAA
jgi:hypothetical protein